MGASVCWAVERGQQGRGGKGEVLLWLLPLHWLLQELLLWLLRQLLLQEEGQGRASCAAPSMRVPTRQQSLCSLAPMALATLCDAGCKQGARPVCLNQRGCVCVCVSAFLCVCMRTRVRVCVRACACVFMCTSVCVYVCVGACVCVCMRIYVDECLCVCVCVCVFVGRVCACTLLT